MDQYRSSHNWALFGVLCTLILTGFLIYSRTLSFDFVAWDDDHLVYKNPLVQEFSWGTVRGAFTSYDPELYIPLTLFTYQVEHALFGFNPSIFHFTNVLLHILNSFLVFLLLTRWGLKRGTAFLAAIVFLVHPLNTEAVAWVSARKDLLSSAFGLLSLLLYGVFQSEQRKWYLWVSLLCFLLALLSKVTVVLLPIVLLLLDWRDGRPLKSAWRDKVPFLLLSCVFIVIALLGKSVNVQNLSLFATLLLGMKSAVFALSKIFFPFGLSAAYLQGEPVSLGTSSFAVAAGVYLLIIGLLCIPKCRTKDVVFGAFFFLFFFIPSFANFSKMGQVYFFADRYTYFAMVGILFLVGKGGKWLLNTGVSDRVQKWVWSTAVLSILLALAWGARERSMVWRESEVLYRDALSHERNERSVALHFDLALLMQKQRRVEEALEEYETVLAIAPSYPKAHNNLGVLFLEQQQFSRAQGEFREVLKVEPRNAEALGNLGLLAMEEGKMGEAIDFLERSVEEDPSLTQTFINLGRAYGKKGMYREGIEAFRRAREIDP